MDRFDIQIRVPRVSYQEITSEVRAEKSAVIRQRVVAARKIQLDRFRELDIVCNAQMNHGILKKYCQLTDEAQELMERAFQERNLSARSYDRIVKVAQTVADLSGSDIISEIHIGEALQLRGEILPGNNF